MRFTKMHGLGNDYVFVSLFTQRVEEPVSLARAVSDRHRGIGSDGLILIGPSQCADLRMEMYNADGSLGQMCGNGIRCVAKYAWERQLCSKARMTVETESGVREVECQLNGTGKVDQVRVNMGPPSFDSVRLPARLTERTLVNYPLQVEGRALVVTCVSVGNPHAIVFSPSFDGLTLHRDGPGIENHPLFPERINAQFARVDSPHEITVVTWERGSGPTRACGTGACAVSAAARRTGRASFPMTIHLPGGDLLIEEKQKAESRKQKETDEHEIGELLMTGPAEEVFEGDWPEASEKNGA